MLRLFLRQVFKDGKQYFAVYNEDDRLVGSVFDTKNICKAIGNVELVIEFNRSFKLIEMDENAISDSK